MRRILVIMLAACSSQQPVSSDHRGPGPEQIDPPTALAPGSCDDAPLHAGAELEVGQRVAVDAVPKATRVCTEKDCLGQACCNRCDGVYFINALGLQLDGLAGCEGMDCNFHCEPFGRSPTKTYRFVGTKASATAFTVEKYCRL